ncbi:MAG: thymidylate synthase, partial [Verrucomicrobiaceae bacterium]
MRLVGRTLDDVLRKLYPRLVRSRNRPQPSRGATREVLGVLLELVDPRARLSRSETRAVPYTGLGELLWYLSRDNQLAFIQHYLPRYADESDDGETVHGGYGPRLFNHRGINQIRNVTERLRGDGSTSRRAVVQIFDAEDMASPHSEVPCTTTLQFFVRSKRLHMLTTMRSNDAWIGLPHDIFCFTMLQEIVARSLGVGLGRYRHFAGSMHLYEDRVGSAEKYLGEGVQSTIAMPQMPVGTPWPAIT